MLKNRETTILYQLWLTPETLENKIANYLKQSGITREEFEKPIRKFLDCETLEDLLSCIENDNITLFSDLQLKLIIDKCDQLLKIFESNCKRKNKKMKILNGLAFGGVFSLVVALGALSSVPLAVILPMGAVFSGLVSRSGYKTLNSENSQYNNIINKLDNAMEKIFLLITEKERVLAEEEKQKRLEKDNAKKQQTKTESPEQIYNCRESINNINKIILYLPQDKRFLVSNRLAVLQGAYRGPKLVLELYKLEGTLRQVLSSSNQFAVLDKLQEYSFGVVSYKDKVAALLELMFNVRLSLSFNDQLFNQQLFQSFAICFWDTVAVSTEEEIVVIVKSVSSDLIDEIINVGKFRVNTLPENLINLELLGKSEYLLALAVSYSREIGQARS
ncbi:MAG: hypothetical protein HFI36_01845 [Bacilli bacterium]|nr:hypothetical protein [Bacilli bacterium]